MIGWLRSLFHRHHFIDVWVGESNGVAREYWAECRCGATSVGVRFDTPITLNPGESIEVDIPLRKPDEG